MPESVCPICRKAVANNMMVYLEHTEKHVIDLIKHDHPHWKEVDGMCNACVEYYQGEINGSTFKDAACALRKRKINTMMDTITNFLKLYKRDKS